MTAGDATASRRGGGDPAVGFTDSWYHHTAHSYTPFAALSESSEADVCIVGGGYTGLSAAIELAQNGYRVVVLEAHKVGSGASGRNGGVLGTGQRKDQDELESWLGKDDTRQTCVRNH